MVFEGLDPVCKLKVRNDLCPVHRQLTKHSRYLLVGILEREDNLKQNMQRNAGYSLATGGENGKLRCIMPKSEHRIRRNTVYSITYGDYAEIGMKRYKKQEAYRVMLL